MRNLIKTVILPLFIIGASALALYIFYLNKPQPQIIAPKIAVPVVNVASAVKTSIKVPVFAQGEVYSQTNTTIIAQVNGVVIHVSDKFAEGRYITKGDILLKLDDSDYRAQLRSAEAGLAQAKSRLASEQGLADAAYLDWKKYSKKVNRSAAATDLALRRPQLAEAKANLLAAKANLQKAKLDLRRTIITAPYNGLIASKQVDIGQYVTIASPLFSLFATDKAELKLSLPENKLQYLKLPSINETGLNNQRPLVTLSHQAYGERLQWQGRLVRTEAKLNSSTRMLTAIVEIEDPYGLSNNHAPLLVGSFVNAEISGKQFNDIIVLPRYLIRPGNKVWVVNRESQLENRQLQILETGGEMVYVIKGLNNGEYISLSNLSGVLPGTKVKINQIIPTNIKSDTDQPSTGKNALPGFNSSDFEKAVTDRPL